MNLRFVVHVVGKDIRRFWWMIALTLALLARLVHFDSMRGFATPGSDEGWLNILLPLAWSFLIALAVLQDPAIGDTPFWATVPCRWTSLLAAKAAFIALVIHVPYFIASCWILASRGFTPLEYIPDLFYRQLVLLALTLASLALATIVRNVTQFMVIAVALATMVTAPFMRLGTDTAEIHHIREILALPVLALTACCIAVMQYGWRRTFAARLTGSIAILVVAVIWWLPLERFEGIQAALSSAPDGFTTPSIRLATGLEPPVEMRALSIPFQPLAASVAIPIVMTDLRENTHLRSPQAELVFIDSAGNRYPTQWTSAQRPAGLRDLPCCTNLIPWWLILGIKPAGYEQIKNVPVSLQGTMYIDYYRPAAAASVHLGKSVGIAGGLQCSVDVPIRDNPAEESLRAECESPNPLPPVQVKLSDPAGGREWEQYIGSSYTVMSYPAGTWLSPIYRHETSFSLTDEEHYRPLGAHWLLPREIVQSVRISLVAEFPEGSQVVSYRIPGITLNRYLVKQ